MKFPYFTIYKLKMEKYSNLKKYIKIYKYKIEIYKYKI